MFGFWIFLSICNLLIPATMLFFGNLFIKHPPKTINGVYGYRTKRSMKNMDTWIFAHQYCGRLWRKWGAVLLVPTLIVVAVSFFLSEDGLSFVSIGLVSLQLAFLVGSIFPVEKALKRTFDEYGLRKK